MLNLDLNTLHIHTETMVKAVLHYEDGWDSEIAKDKIEITIVDNSIYIVDGHHRLIEFLHNPAKSFVDAVVVKQNINQSEYTLLEEWYKDYYNEAL